MKSLITVGTLLGLWCHIAMSQILAIDFGTQYVKSALVNSGTGKSFTIVENHRSDRKFVNSIGFYNQQRIYDEESLSKRGKFPMNCFLFNKLLIDSSFDHSIAAKVKKDFFLQYIDASVENQLMAEFVLKGFPEQSSEVTLIEVVGMILKYAKGNAEKQFGVNIKDAILTVPNYWNLKMRAFILQAAQIADLYVLSLISENSGAAINYALNQRSKNVTEKILFYNLGANSLQMTIAQFKQFAEDKSSKPVQSIFILADYGKPYVGGLKFDRVLLNYFKDKFQKKYSRQLTTRAQIKMLEQIVDTKQILSSNKEATLFVEGLMDGIDFNQKITRKQFETKCKKLIQDLIAPIKPFLLENNMKPSDLTSVQLIGGSVRIPLLQSLLAEVIGNSSKIGTHINGDQAMVLGAAFQGANSSKKFKVKGINLYDGFNFQIRAVLKNLVQNIDQDDQHYFHKNVTLFKRKNRFGLTKQLNFKCKQNIIVELYKQDESGLELIRSVKLDNIQAVNESQFKVSITLAIDPIETIIIKKAEIKYKRQEITSYMEKVKKQIPKGKQQSLQQEQQQQEQQDLNTDQNQDKQQNLDEQKQDNQESEKSSDNDDDKKQKQEKKHKKTKLKSKKPKVQYETVQKNKTVTKTYSKDLHKQDIYSHEIADHQSTQRSRNMLKQYQKNELQKKQLDQSKNKLEALVYQVFDKLQNQQFMQFVQSQEKNKLSELASQKSEWQNQYSENERKQYDRNFRQLNKPLQKIKKRIGQYEGRQLAKKRALQSLDKHYKLSLNITTKKSWVGEQVVQQLVSDIESAKEEIADVYSKMSASPKYQNAVYVSADFEKIAQKIKDKYFKVMATPEPKKQKQDNKSDKDNTEKEASEESGQDNQDKNQDTNSDNSDQL